jgi:hypothetical protein
MSDTPSKSVSQSEHTEKPVKLDDSKSEDTKGMAFTPPSPQPYIKLPSPEPPQDTKYNNEPSNYTSEAESKISPRDTSLDKLLILALANLMIGKDYPNVGQIVDTVSPIFKAKRAKLFEQIRSEVNRIPMHIETERINKKMVLEALTRMEKKQ